MRESFLITLLAFWLSLGCQPPGKSEPQGAKDSKKRSASSDDDRASDGPSNESEDLANIVKSDLEGASLVAANMKFKLVGHGTSEDTDICDGDIDVRVVIPDLDSPNIDPLKLLQLDQSTLECAGFDIDLQAVFGFLADFIGEEESTLPDMDIDYQVSEGVLYVTQIGDTRYTPKRPTIANFIAEKPSVLETINTSDTVTVSSLEGSGSGRASLKMTAFAQPFQGTLATKPWPKTFTMQLTHEGFEDIQIPQNVLLDQITLSISQDPLMLVGFSIKSSLWDIVVGAQDQESRDGILGSIIENVITSDFVESIAKDVTFTLEVDDCECAPSGTPTQRKL